MKKLTVSPEMFNRMLTGLIQSGVTFEAVERPDELIYITFTGGY